MGKSGQTGDGACRNLGDLVMRKIAEKGSMPLDARLRLGLSCPLPAF